MAVMHKPTEGLYMHITESKTRQLRWTRAGDHGIDQQLASNPCHYIFFAHREIPVKFILHDIKSLQGE